MNETIASIMNRRSVRVFSSDPIKDEELKAIIECGLYAPSTSNEQSWHFTVLRDQEMLDRMSADAKRIAGETADGYIAQLAANEKFHTFYHAPVVIVVSGEKGATLPMTDCAAASENMLIAAESLGIGSCWVGFTNFIFAGEKGEDYRKELGISENYKPYYALAFGYKTHPNGSAPPRREGTVNYR